MKIAETRDLEDEVQRIRSENAELRKRIAEFASTQTAKRRAETKLGQLEEKVCHIKSVCSHSS